MFVPFESLPLNARVWIVQADRRLSTEELSIVHEQLRKFTEEWSVHGAPLPTSYSIQFDQFILLAADESQQGASGCSIDSSVRALKTLGQTLNVDLFDRNKIAFKIDQDIFLVPLPEIKQKFRDGILTEGTLTFNNLVDTREAWKNNWIVPAGATWLKRYITNPLANVK